MTADDRDRLGSKAVGLARLSTIGLVPRFIVLRASWLSSQGANLEMRLLQCIDQEGIIPPFAVRSSASDEDGLTSSFAGMYETRLGISREGLPRAVNDVARSGASGRLSAYRAARNLAASNGAINVIIQEMVNATAAGVAFSRDAADPSAVRVEAVQGIGEELVSGTAIPETFLLDRCTLDQRCYIPGRQYIMLRCDGSRSRMSAREVRARRLTAEQARAVAAQAVTLESIFPEAVNGVDMEWAFADGQLNILQCRPITAPPAALS